jgi:hypothetical protein
MIMIDHGGYWEAQTLKDFDESLIDSMLSCVANAHRNLGPGLFLINFNKPLLKDGIKRVSI